MPITLEDLDRRLTALEREVAALRPPSSELLPEPGSVEEAIERIPMLRRAREVSRNMAAEVEKVLDQMGIRCEPIGAEKLQAMILAEGIIDPHANEFSRGLIEMREE